MWGRCTAPGPPTETPRLFSDLPDDFRIFCGDLGNEVNDDILARAFSRYPSFLKAKVPVVPVVPAVPAVPALLHISVLMSR